ncbi:MAG TPA: LptF/LptG family permease [Halanaerobiales bacterium]|nr:LptF/LptG family permease [Halanaerobiales bacterium]
MKLVYKYISKELIAPFLFGVAAFVGIFIGTDLLFRLTDFYSNWGIGIITLIKLFFLSLPSIIVLTFPMATLLATIMAYSRMSNDSEITAFRAGGVSIYKLVIPALILGLIMSFVAIGLNEYVVPKSNYLYDRIVWEFKHGEKLPSTQYNLYLTPIDNESNRPDYILYTHKFDGDTGVMTDVYLQDYDGGKPTVLIQAESAKWLETGWKFFDGKIFYLKTGERIPALEFDEYNAVQIFNRPSEISKLNKKISDMSFNELREYINLKESQGRVTREERVKLHQRISIPFASFIFALLAAPLGIKPGRSSGSAVGLGLSIIVIFIYYILMTVGDAMGSQGTITPWLGAWLQNIVFLIIGSVLLYRVAS